MSTYGNINGAQKEIKPWYTNIGGAQKTLSNIYANVNGAQKTIYTKQKTVSLSSLATGSKFWINDTEGFAEYEVLEQINYYGYGTQIGVMCIRTNALNVNIINVVKDTYISSSVISPGATSITRNICSNISSYVSWASQKAYSYNAYNGRDDNGLSGASLDVYCGWEALDGGNDQYYTPRWFFYDNKAFLKTVNTNNKLNVPCFYNNGSYDYYDDGDNGYLYYNDLYYYQSSQEKNAYATYRSSSNTVEFSNMPTELYFRPCLVFRDQTVTTTD